MTKDRNPLCLHCTIMFAIETFYKHRGQIDDATGNYVIDMTEAIAKVGEVMADIVHRAPTRPQRRRFEKYARDCLEAGFRLQVTGKVQAVELDEPEAEH
jgi:hypothetical protein